MGVNGSGAMAGVSAWGESVVLQLVTVHALGKECHFLEVLVLAGTRALR